MEKQASGHPGKARRSRRNIDYLITLFGKVFIMRAVVDLVILNAVVRIMDDSMSEASAFAVSGGRIVAVGSDADVAALISGDTEVHDLQGAVVVPGLVDAHVHHALGGRADLYECQFPNTATVAEIVEAVREWATAHPEQEWIVGGTWGASLFEALREPSALRLLDAAAPGRKVLLTDDSHHNKWANTLALSAAGFTDSTPDPLGGNLLRSVDGSLTGVLLERAGALVEMARTEEKPEDADFWALCSCRGVQILNQYGITAFMEAAAFEEILRGIAAYDSNQGATAHIVSAMLVNDFIFGVDRLGKGLFEIREEVRTMNHQPDFAKILLDGVPPAFTAAFIEPYKVSEQHGACFHGSTFMDFDHLLDWLRVATDRGLGVKIHCTGDAAVRQVLEAVRVVRGEGSRIIIHVAHGQYVAEEDVPVLAELDVVAEISPALYFPNAVVEAHRAVLNEPLASRISPNRTLLDTGAVVAGGSDWPVVPAPNPWPAISALVTRSDPYGKLPGSVWPEQAITVQEALHAYTGAAARALGMGDEIGSIEVGKSADFAVLDRDPFLVEPSEVAWTVVLQTWFNGARVHG